MKVRSKQRDDRGGSGTVPIEAFVFSDVSCASFILKQFFGKIF